MLFCAIQAVCLAVVNHDMIDIYIFQTKKAVGQAFLLFGVYKVYLRRHVKRLDTSIF